MLYSALWRALPGPRVAVKVLLALVLVLAVVAFCFLWLFPRIAPLMPFNDNTVDAGARAHRRPLPARARRGHRMTRILVVDNYDSFVFTIVGYLQQLGAECDVVRNDAVVARTRCRTTTGCWSPRGRARPRRRGCRWR